jgi:4-hydroxybenzoate polyprenyltransferase
MSFSPENITAYAKLMRLHRPIGIYLVLWPTLWALWLAAEGIPSIGNLVIFILGVVLMRSAGCVINDYADRKVDGHVKRTADRPLVSGEVSEKEAKLLFAGLIAVAFVLVLFTNRFTILLSFGAVCLAISYPFMKRFTHLPQVVLGAAFAWAIPMAFAAELNSIDPKVWLLYTSVLVWTVMYDTMYAMADREEDLKIGVKSTAILFGDQDKFIVACLQFMTIFALGLVGQRFELGAIYKLSLLVAAALFIYQQYLIAERDPASCIKAFLNNNYVGAAIFVGIAADLFLAN